MTTKLLSVGSYTVFVAILLITGFFSRPAYAGTGTYKDGRFSFCVSVRFNATPEQLRLIREGFERASQVLADATDGQHRFGTVSIVNNRGAAQAAEFWIYNNFEATHARNAKYGIKGKHVQMDFGYDFGTVEESAYVIAHEFAHDVYTLGDEYQGQKPLGNFISTECAPRPDFPTLNFCLMDDFDKRGGRANGGTTYTLNEFCVASNHDKPNPDGTGGNDTDQHVTHGRSCWETMSALRKSWKLRPFSGLPSDAPPSGHTVSFKTTCGQRKVALLIDRSGSMTTDNRIGYAKLGGGQFINSYADGALAVISFSGAPSVNLPLTEIADDTARNKAKEAVNSLVASGATNIGDGLLAALGQLTTGDDCDTCEKTIILLSDGEHNIGTPPESVVSALNDAGIRLVTSVVGSSISLSGENSLRNLTAQTNGEFHRISTAVEPAGQPLQGYGASGLIGLFTRLGRDMADDALVKQQREVMASGQNKEIPVLLEAGASNATFAVTIADQNDNVTLSLRKPSGTTLTGPSTGVEFVSDSNSRMFRVSTPEAGIWRIIVTAGAVITGKVEVLSFAKHDGVQLHASVDEETIYSPEKIKVHAVATYDGQNVVGATVIGTAIRPDGSKLPISLFDSGLLEHGDREAGDGVYSALFNDYSTDGAYTFELLVENASGHTYAGELIFRSSPPNEKSVPPFTRAASATVIVSGLTMGDTIWVDDAVPQGATSSSVQDGWYWVSSNPAAIAGGAAHQSLIYDGYHQHAFEGAAAKLPIRAGESLFAYVFLDPLNMPREIALQWHDGTSWEHRAYWGANNLGEWVSASTYVEFGINGTNSRRYMGPMPSAGRWVRLTVPASLVGLEGKTVSGMAFTLDGGRATWDRIGKTNTLEIGVRNPRDVIFVEDRVPDGAVAGAYYDIADRNGEPFCWVSRGAPFVNNSPCEYAGPPPFSGDRAHRTHWGSEGDNVKFRKHFFSGMSNPVQINPGDVLFTYVNLNTQYPPDDIYLERVA